MRPDATTRAGTGARFLIGFGALFALAGAGAAFGVVQKSLHGGDREALVVGLLVGGLFVLVGVGLVVAGLHARRTARAAAALRAAHPDEPWRWRPLWADGRVSCQGGAGVVAIWFFALVWNGISTPVAWFVPRQAAKQGEPWMWVAMLFPAVGALLLVWAIRATLRWRRFGVSTLELKTFPGVVGGRLEGRLHLNVPLEARSGMAFRLECVHRYTSGSGDDRNTHESLQWQQERRVPRERFSLGPTGSAVPVGFTIPYDCAPSRDWDRDDEILWRLTAGAAVPGVDYHAQFEVPVFRTAESSPDVDGDDDALPEVVASPTGDGALPDSRIQVRPWRAGYAFWFGPARNPGVATSLTAVAAAFAAGSVLAVERGAPFFLQLVLFGVTFPAGLAAFVHWFGATRVRTEPGVIHVTRGPFAIGRTRTWRAGEVSRIAVRRGTQYGQQLYWNIALEIDDARGRRRSDGSPWSRRHYAGGRLPSRDEARALARAMAESAGIALGPDRIEPPRRRGRSRRR